MLQVVLMSGNVLSVQVALSNGKWIHGGWVMRLSRLVFPVSHIFIALLNDLHSIQSTLYFFHFYQILADFSASAWMFLFVPSICIYIFWKSAFMQISQLVGVVPLLYFLSGESLDCKIFTCLLIPVPVEIDTPNKLCDVKKSSTGACSKCIYTLSNPFSKGKWCLHYIHSKTAIFRYHEAQ